MIRRLLPVWVLSIAAFILATTMAWAVQGAMPQIEDEHANLFQAKVFASGRITVDESPVQPLAFYIPFIIHDNGHVFGKYTPGYPLLLALGALIDQPWLINALAAALSVWGVYLLGRDLYNHRTGLLAAALGAISPMAFMLSGTLLAHTSTLTALVFGMWGFVRARRSTERQPRRFAVLAGVAIGWALISRPWTAVAISLPLALIALNDLFNHPRRFFRLYAVMFVAFLLVASIWPLYNWLTTGSPTTNTYTLWWPYDRVGFGPGYGRLSGHTWQRGIQNFRADFSDLGVTLLSWPSIAGVPLAWLSCAAGVVLAGIQSPRLGAADPAGVVNRSVYGLLGARQQFVRAALLRGGPALLVDHRGARIIETLRKTLAASRRAAGTAALAGLQYRLHDRAATAAGFRSLRARTSATRSDRGGSPGQCVGVCARGKVVGLRGVGLAELAANLRRTHHLCAGLRSAG